MARTKKVTVKIKKGDEAQYSTMTHVLEAILNAGIVAEMKAIEFGPGLYSTPLLIGRCHSVLSIEKREVWFKELKKTLGSNENFEIRLVDNALLSGAYLKDFDLVVVDGDTEDRVPVTNAALCESVPVVVVHDTDKVGWYGFHKLAPGPNYVRFDYEHTKTRKQTTMFAHFLIADRLGLIKPKEHKRL